MHINIFNFSFLFVPYILRLFFKGHGEKLFMKGYHQWFMKGYHQWFMKGYEQWFCNAMNNGFATL
jgi:hypothetical protein